MNDKNTLIKKCSTCKYWKHEKNRYNSVLYPSYHPITFEEWKSKEELLELFPDNVRYCTNPKVLFYKRPASDGVAVFDGSAYDAYLTTGRDFGCVNHEDGENGEFPFNEFIENSY